MKIALLDGDPSHMRTIVSVIESIGSHAFEFSLATDLLSALQRETFDLLIVDWALPDGSGLEVVRQVHLNFDPPPLMLLVTARTDDADLIAGLEAGADDCLARPISSPVLAARMGALLRRASPRPSGNMIETHAGLTFDPTNSTVTIRGEPVVLTSKEFALSILLFRNPRRALSRSYLIETVWGGAPGVSSRSLDMHIARIRSKLQLRRDHGFRLMPVYGYGYRLEV